MTPYQFAKEYCANCVGNYFCIHRDAKCLLVGEPYKPPRMVVSSRCRYFEDCVLPIADQPPPVGDTKWQNRLVHSQKDARDQYRRAWNLTQWEGRRCPDCGEPLARRQRICAVCREKRRRKTYREAQARKRGAAVNS